MLRRVVFEDLTYQFTGLDWLRPECGRAHQIEPQFVRTAEASGVVRRLIKFRSGRHDFIVYGDGVKHILVIQLYTHGGEEIRNE